MSNFWPKSRVSYEKDQLEKAKSEGKTLITIDINRKYQPGKGGRSTVQGFATDEILEASARLLALFMGIDPLPPHKCDQHKDVGPISNCECCRMANVLNKQDGLPIWVALDSGGDTGGGNGGVR